MAAFFATVYVPLLISSRLYKGNLESASWIEVTRTRSELPTLTQTNEKKKLQDRREVKSTPLRRHQGVNLHKQGVKSQGKLGEKSELLCQHQGVNLQ